jgi:hypothetical protein
MFAGGSSIWPFVIELDLRERVLSRNRQKLSLGRYGRQPLSVWRGRFVSEIDHAMDDMTVILSREQQSNPEDQ